MANVLELEPNDTFSGANALPLGDNATGSLSSTIDWDYFKITAASSGVLKLDFTSPISTGGEYFNVVVYDSSQKQLAYFFVTSSTSLNVGAAVAGTYYVAVTSGTSLYTAEQYGLGVSMGADMVGDYEAEQNGTLSTANLIALGHTIKGQLSGSADADYFRVTANEGGVLALDFSAPHVTADSAFTVAIYDAAGNLLQTRATGNALTLTTTVGSAGSDYYVQVSQGQATEFDSGNYSLTTHVDTLPDMAAKSLDYEWPVMFSLTSPHDWYQVSLTAGSIYEFKMSGASTGGGTLADPSLSLCAPNGVALEACDNLAVWRNGKVTTNLDPQIAFTAPATGIYYLMIGGNGGVGTFTFTKSTYVVSDLVQSLLPLRGDADTPSLPNARWNGGSPLGTPVTLTYAFLTAADDGELGFKAMSAGQQQSVVAVLNEYHAIANITFVQTSDQSAAQIRFGTSKQETTSGITYTASNVNGSLKQADVFLDNSSGSAAAYGGHDFQALIHELGHALGLKHPGEYNAGSGSASGPFLPASLESLKFTEMSYVDTPDASVYGDTPGLLDIAAVQYLYGANTSGNGQVRTFSFSNNTPFISSLLSSGTSDTLDLSNQLVGSKVFLTPGTLSSIGVDANGYPAIDNLAIPFGENVVKVMDGLGADLLVGNGKDNTFISFSVADKTHGAAGNDTLDGGGGIDTVVYSDSRTHYMVTPTETGYTVKDIVGTNGTDTLSTIERLQFSDSKLAIDLDGHAGEAAKILGAVFGKTTVTQESFSKEYVGVGLGYLDSGMNYPDLMLKALNANLGVGFTDTAEINLLYQNLVGAPPSTADRDYWQGTLSSGQFNQTSLAVMAAELDLNKSNIDLVGLAKTGIEYS